MNYKEFKHWARHTKYGTRYWQVQLYPRDILFSINEMTLKSREVSNTLSYFVDFKEIEPYFYSTVELFKRGIDSRLDSRRGREYFRSTLQLRTCVNCLRILLNENRRKRIQEGVCV